MIRALWRHVTYNYGKGGTGQVLSKIAGRLRRWMWSDDMWRVYCQDTGGVPLETRLPLTETLLDFDALREHRYFKAYDFPEAMRERLDCGARCHGCLLDGELVNVGWTSVGYLELVPGIRILDKDSIAIYDCYTPPEFRERGYYTESLIRMLRQIRDAGAARALIAVDPDNIPSIKAIERAGFQPLYNLTVNRRFGCHLRRECEFRAGVPRQEPVPGLSLAPARAHRLADLRLQAGRFTRRLAARRA
jgi:RimJ/RimL family protein N-acetyltransferase